VTPRRRENRRWAGPCGLASLVCPPDRLFSGQTIAELHCALDWTPAVSRCRMTRTNRATSGGTRAHSTLTTDGGGPGGWSRTGHVRRPRLRPIRRPKERQSSAKVRTETPGILRSTLRLRSSRRLVTGLWRLSARSHAPWFGHVCRR